MAALKECAEYAMMAANNPCTSPLVRLASSDLAEQVEQLAQLTALVTPDREIKEKGSFDKQVNISAEHLTNLADKKVCVRYLKYLIIN